MPLAPRLMLVAAFDPADSVDRSHHPDHVRLRATPGTSREAATASVADAVPHTLPPGQSDRLDAAPEAARRLAADRPGIGHPDRPSRTLDIG